MIKNFYLAFAFIVSFATSSLAQIADYSVAPDWTATDLNGEEHNLYQYLDSGYAVFLDLSAAWCGPCWTFHQQGVMQELWDLYGPDTSATDEIRVFYIESEATNTTAQLYGTGTSGGGANRATDTWGDWVTGHTFPFIDDASIAGKYELAAYPTAIFIGPDRLTRAFVGAPGPSTESIYQLVQDNAGPITDSIDVRIMEYSGQRLTTCGMVSPQVRIQNHGFNDLTSATYLVMADDSVVLDTLHWTGNLAAYQTAFVNFDDIDLTGHQSLSIMVIDPLLDSVPKTFVVDGVRVLGEDETGGNWDFEESDTTLQLPAGSHFDPASGFQIYAVSNEAFTDVVQPVGGFGESDYSLFVPFYSVASGTATVYFDKIDLRGYTTPALYFNHAYRSYAGENDGLVIEVSSDCGETWTVVYSRFGANLATLPPATASFIPNATDWQRNVASLGAVAGDSSVIIRFHGVSAYGNNLWLDDFQLGDFCSSIGVSSSPIWDLEDATPGSPELPDGMLQDPTAQVPARVSRASDHGVSTHEIGGYGQSEFALSMNFHNGRTGDVSGFVLDKVDLSGMSSPRLHYSHAYKRHPLRGESMVIEASTDCGATWTLVQSLDADSLNTAGAQIAFYVPAPDEWQRTSIALDSSLAGETEVVFRFVATGNRGNNIWIDDIEVSEFNAVDQDFSTIESIQLYPNPVTDQPLTLEIKLEQQENVYMRLIDGLGRTIDHTFRGDLSAGTHTLSIPTDQLVAGRYHIWIERTADGAGRAIPFQKLND